MSLWDESHAREALAAHLCEPYDFYIYAHYHKLPDAEKEHWRRRADAALKALLDSEDSLRMGLIQALLVEGSVSVSSGTEGYKVKETPR